MRLFSRSKLAAVVFAGLALAHGAVAWPEGKARQGLFIQQDGKLLVYRIEPGMVRSEPIVAQVGSHYENRTVYYYGRPILQSVLVPDYQKIGENVFLDTATGEKTFTNPHWQLVDVIDKDGFPLLHAQTDIENALESFGLKFSPRKGDIVHALLEGSTPAIVESYTPVAEIEIK
jgi:hypothetical protein